ncbi:MAG: response regulator [Bacteroidota bacterium]
MDNIKILWADDEIDLLKPQLLFLKKKGYDVITVTNGHDALEECEENDVDVVFLDESMPGITGLETLEQIKAKNPHLPVVMITKNEAEHVMEEAIGAQISDYLIKPVNPNQILLTLKKLIDNKRLVREKTSMSYQQEFRQISMQINSGLDFKEWVDAYRDIISWELRIDESNSDGMTDILAMQKSEANAEFSRYVIKNYIDWVSGQDESPLMSNTLLRQKVLTQIKEDRPTIMLLLDNLRYDQWKMLEPIIAEYYRVEEEDYFYSILPTSTQYSRNAIFAGLMPSEIQEYYPEWWKNDNEKGGKNLHEHDLLASQIDRLVRRKISFDYIKVTNVGHAKTMADNIYNYLNNDLTVIVYNFIDMLSHARTEMEVLKELAGDERAYRSLTRSWFAHSPLWDALKRVSERDIQLIITTDHGTIRVGTPSRVVGDRETTTNLRYKVGRNLQYDRKDVLEVRKPEKALLPRPNVSSTFIFAKEDKFFLYPNNYNHYNNYYRDTFQHGGISLEEIICPVIRLSSK